MTVDEAIEVLIKLSRAGKGSNELTVFRPFDDESLGGFEPAISIIWPDDAPNTMRIQCDDYTRVPFDEDDLIFDEDDLILPKLP
ncbi:MAG: hypothetical protein GY807_23505 [Gammaproteobacteria bacterium]|nr:hypothetical protein [Gammaproteobacteria bacterium]